MVRFYEREIQSIMLSYTRSVLFFTVHSFSKDPPFFPLLGEQHIDVVLPLPAERLRLCKRSFGIHVEIINLDLVVPCYPRSDSSAPAAMLKRMIPVFDMI